MITFGSASIYSSYGNAKDRLPMDVVEAISVVTKKPFPKWKRFIPIGISSNMDDGTDCLLPDVRYEIVG